MEPETVSTAQMSPKLLGAKLRSQAVPPNSSNVKTTTVFETTLFATVVTTVATCRMS